VPQGDALDQGGGAGLPQGARAGPLDAGTYLELGRLAALAAKIHARPDLFAYAEEVLSKATVLAELPDLSPESQRCCPT